jgi:hypothetical protein
MFLLTTALHSTLREGISGAASFPSVFPDMSVFAMSVLAVNVSMHIRQKT